MEIRTEFRKRQEKLQEAMLKHRFEKEEKLAEEKKIREAQKVEVISITDGD